MIKNKQNAIIFDFMRTLYDPETRNLELGAKEVLEYSIKKYDCYLVSYDEGEKEELFIELGIKKFFTSIELVERKTKLTFQKILKNKYRKVFVVGDRIESEIQIGNKLHFKTIWYRKGKFSTREPLKKIEHPKYIIENLIELKKLL